MEGTAELKAELNIGLVQSSDAGVYYCRAEPKYFQHDVIKTYFFKESFITLNVVNKHVENTAYHFMPLSVNLMLFVCCNTLFL